MTYRSRILTTMAASILLLGVPTLSHAASVLFTNFGTGFSYNTSFGNFVGDGLDGSGNNYAEGNTFTPSTTADFTSLDIALSCFFGAGACTDALTVSLDANSGTGTPDSVLESFVILGSSLGGLGANSAPLFLTSVGAPLLLTAATPYWVTVSSDTANSIVWNSNVTGDSSSEANSTDGGTTWLAQSGLTPGAYQVNGTSPSSVPEPSTLVLLAGALLLLVLAIRSGVLPITKDVDLTISKRSQL